MITASLAGKLASTSRSSFTLWAVITLNLAVSITNFRAERACSGSGSAMMNVGRATEKKMQEGDHKVAQQLPAQ